MAFRLPRKEFAESGENVGLYDKTFISLVVGYVRLREISCRAGRIAVARSAERINTGANVPSIGSVVDTASAEFQDNAVAMRGLADELGKRRGEAALGGPLRARER